MNEVAIQEAPPNDVVMRWLKVWHVVYIGGLLICTAIALWDMRGAWGTETAVMLGAVALLIALYSRQIVFYKSWPQPLWVLIVYYAVVVAVWLLLVNINGVYFWVAGMLIGQMFGVLPPVAAPVGAITVLGLTILAANDWQFPKQISITDVLTIAVQIGFLLLLYFYVYNLIRGSRQRDELVGQLQAANAQLAIAHEQQVELATLRERERVARDLHDGLGHSLVVLSVQLEAIQRLYRVDPDRASDQVDAMKQLTRDSMTQLRQTLDGLRTSNLGGQSLDAALQQSCVAFSLRTGLKVTCDVDPAAADLSPATAETLWQVSQEALANVERHATATAVMLRLQLSATEVSLYIEDNGRGLPPNAENMPGHYGLRGMRERIEGLGGTLTLGTSGVGTAVSVTIPVIVGAVLP